MNGYKKRYKVYIETVGPIHIGSGCITHAKHYFYHKETNKIYVIDEKKLYHFLKESSHLEQYERYCYHQSMETDALAFDGFLVEAGISFRELEHCISYSMNAQDINLKESGHTTGLEIKTFLKDAYEKPYVPASSLRGVIRSALLCRELIGEREESEAINKIRNKWNKEFDSEEFENELEEMNVFAKEIGLSFSDNVDGKEEKNWSKMIDRYMSAVSISDSKPLSKNKLILCQKVDMLYGTKAKRNNLNVIYESLKPGTKIEFELTINDSLLENYPEVKKMVSVENILEALSIYYQNIQDVFVSKYTELNFLNRKGNDKATYLYLGGGTGYVSKSLTYPLLGYLDGVKITSRILHWKNLAHIKSASSLNQENIIGRHHHNSEDLVVSPHVLKCTKYHKKLLEMGLSRIMIEDMKT